MDIFVPSSQSFSLIGTVVIFILYFSLYKNEEQINANNIVNSKIISKVPEKEVENLIDHQLEENAFLDQSTSIIIDDSNVSFPLDKKATLEIINFDEDFETDDDNKKNVIINFDEDFETDDDIKKNVIINFDEGIDDVDNNEINTTPDRNVYIDANKNNGNAGVAQYRREFANNVLVKGIFGKTCFKKLTVYEHFPHNLFILRKK